MSILEKINQLSFENPIHRLILLKILNSGNMDGIGERIISHEDMAHFCCCHSMVIFRETKNLENHGIIKVRKIFTITDGKVKTEPFRAYELQELV
ncbi:MULTISPECIES: hypothetical protein [Xenorhabdus]|uniref:Transcriptional regulator n=1 Tax=Xenorhabdus thuongxuanensis TaxID=1873484 RepID=A0A1Q5U8K3_9GAMM|nr:hypothetical protein [Xenorhabdus thuongxuanensis]OKP08783.1 hypothetical protein Xentx_00454 [Xenorhabdus thuongxuanensis]